MTSSKIKVLHIAKWFPNENDPQNGVFIQNQILANSHFSSQAVLYWGIGDEEKLDVRKEDGIPTMRLYFSEGSKLSSAARKWSSIKAIIEETWGDAKPDVIHLHIADNDQWVALEYAKGNKIPVVLTDHWSGYLDARFQSKSIISKSLTSALWRRVDYATTVSNFLADAIIKATGRKDISIIPNVVDTHGVQPNHDTNTPSLNFGVLADLDDEIKNISGIVRAFRELYHNHSEARLHIIGDGKDRGKLERLVAENNLVDAVIFHGRNPHSKSMELLSEVDTVILNSRRETFSVVCLEAIALGKKLISTRCGGPETTLLDENVMWVNVEDDIQLHQAMEASIDAPFPSEKSIENQVKPYTPESVSNQWFTVYTQLARKSR